MAEIKIPDDPKVKRLLVIAVGLALGVGAYWYFLWRPDHAEVVGIAAHADTLERDNALIKAAVENGEERRIKAATDRYNAELAILRRLVPTYSEVPALIDGVSTAARQSGMELANYTPAGELPGDYFNSQRYSFSVTGPYHRVAEFFTAVASFDRILVPANVSILPSGRKMERRPGRDEVFVDVNFDILTYVAKQIPTTAGAR
jgi:type IV pilus assembly protein PilO